MLVRNIMTERVVSVSPQSSVLEAAEAMLSEKIAGLPVIDSDGKLVGIVTEGDLLRRWEMGTERKHTGFEAFKSGKAGIDQLAADYVRSHGRRVCDVMSTKVISVEEGEQLDVAIHFFEKFGFKQIPITRVGRVVGIVSRADILRAFATAVHQIKSADLSDEAIRRTLFSIYTQEIWSPLACMDITVNDGVVELFGNAESENQRRAAITAAEGVPGVKKVIDHLTTLPVNVPPQALG